MLGLFGAAAGDDCGIKRSPQPEAAGWKQLEVARALATAQLVLKRIRATRIAATPTGLDQMLDPQVLRGLCAFDRYERLALSQRKAAKRRLDEVGGVILSDRLKALRKMGTLELDRALSLQNEANLPGT